MLNIFKNKKEWNTFNPSEMEIYKQDIFNHYRQNGFPFFPTDFVWRQKEYEKMQKYDFKKCIDYTNKKIKQSMHGLSLCWSYHPHHYSVPCNNMKTVMDRFQDDDSFKRVIDRRIKIGDNISNSGIIKMLKIFTGTQCVSNFRPTAAAAIYSLFCQKGESVYDMSMGYGGRCLGAHLAGVKYNAVDPDVNTFKGVAEMIKDFSINANIFQQGSEERIPLEDQSVDFSFTSPPYFDCEKYSDDDTQSYKKYPTKELWMNGFIEDTLLETGRVTKKGKFIAINIQSVKSYKNIVSDFIEKAQSIGLTYDDQWELNLSNLLGSKYKTEPIIVFKNN
jgi:hypothetical protein